MSFENDIEENINTGLIDIMILKLLSQVSMYGYQIRQEIYKRSNGTIEIKEGSLYGPLYRLEKKSFITSKKVLVGAKRFRVYYEITDLGNDYLNCGVTVYKRIFYGAKSLLLED